jgi:hypothetical protein
MQLSKPLEASDLVWSSQKYQDRLAEMLVRLRRGRIRFEIGTEACDTTNSLEVRASKF